MEAPWAFRSLALLALWVPRSPCCSLQRRASFALLCVGPLLHRPTTADLSDPPTRWQFGCDSAASVSGDVCSVRFFLDDVCSAPLAGVESTNRGSQSTEVTLSEPAVVQCVTYQDCDDSAASCNTLALRRSSGTAGWHNVAVWDAQASVHVFDAQSGNLVNSLSLSSTMARPSTDVLEVLDWIPSPSTCGSGCGRDGIQPTQTLEVRFSHRVYPGQRNVDFSNRSGNLGSLHVPASDTSWFQVHDIGSASTLRITPNQPLGASSACGRVVLSQGAFVNADGYGLPASEARFCIRDMQAPVLQTSALQPQHEAIDVPLDQSIRFQFNEELELATGASARLTVTTLVPPQRSQIRSIGLGTQQLVDGAMGIELAPSDLGGLAYETRYSLNIPHGALLDRAGNDWSGYRLEFTTRCPPSGCQVPADPGLDVAGTSMDADRGSEDSSQDSSTTVLIVSVIVGLVMCLGCMSALLCYRRAQRRKAPPPSPKTSPKSKSTEPLAPWASTAAPPSLRKTAGGDSPMSGKGAKVAEGPRQATVPVSFQSPTGRRTAGDAVRAQGPAFPKNSGTRPHNGRSYEAEDVRQEPWSAKPHPPRSHMPKEKIGKAGSFTEDDAVGGGWVKSSEGGRTFWFNYNTMESRWTPPPRPDADSPKAQSWPKAKAFPKAATPPPSSNTASAKLPGTPSTGAPPAENTELARFQAEILDQLDKTKKEDIASRKKTFKFLCLRWHPDKNTDNLEIATDVFQYLQHQKEWYLRE